MLLVQSKLFSLCGELLCEIWHLEHGAFCRREIISCQQPNRRHGGSNVSSLVLLQYAGGDPAVSSTVNPMVFKRSKVKTEADGPHPISTGSQVCGILFTVTLGHLKVFKLQNWLKRSIKVS